MGDGVKKGQGLNLSTNSFSFSDCNFLVKVLFENFNIKASVQSAGSFNPCLACLACLDTGQYNIYI